MVSGLIFPAVLISMYQAAAQDAAEPADQSMVIVSAKRKSEEDIRDFVHALTQVPYSGQLSRFERSICPVVRGLSQPQGQAVADRMRRVAGAVGIRVGDSDCYPNVVVVVTADKKAFIQELRRSRPEYFGEMSRRRIRELAEEPGPAAAWQLAGPPVNARGVELRRDSGGQMRGIYVNRTITGASRITSATRPQFAAAVVVVERHALAGLTTTQLADYAAMRAFADADPARLENSGAPSILRVLEAPMGREVPITLTQWDMAFLRGFYASPRNLSTAAQRSAISESMAQGLERADE
jgi:hypothetical protein